MIETNRYGAVAEIVISNPPVNALAANVGRALAGALSVALEDDAVSAIVLRGAGKLFSGGADIAEFGVSFEPDQMFLPNLIDEIEASPKPVIAAIHGMALGGGLELALGCHYRIATSEAKLGLPEVKLGLLPGAGGTQRLPRLVGAEMALSMIVSGDPISAEKALEIGLVDKLVEQNDFAHEAIGFASRVSGVRRASQLKVVADDALFSRFAQENARKIDGLDAASACLEAVRAATDLPYAQSVAVERELFGRLVSGDQSKALRHIFFAKRAAAKVNGLPRETLIRGIKRIGVIGFGTMGSGISINFLSAGIPVTVVETQKESLDRGVGVVRRNFEANAAKGRMTPEQAEQAMSLLTCGHNFSALADCDLIIEAVYEDMAVKKEIFTRIDAVAKPGAILASNTSYLSIDEIASATARPGDVLGLHFFSPANVMKLVEVVRGRSTGPDVLATTVDLARRIGKVPVVARDRYGFIGNRMLEPRQREATALLLEGATPQQIDRVHTDFGMPMGPFQMADLAGVDIGWHRDTARIETLQDALCAEGRWGQKVGAGFYDYDERRRPSSSPATFRIIEDFRIKAGRTARVISDEEIVVRTLFTMINEGAKILEGGVAQRASDIDVVWVFGYGWPRTKGGPMFWADQLGWDAIADGLRRYRDRLAPDFELAATLAGRSIHREDQREDQHA